MHRFYWLIEGEIAGCSLPGGSELNRDHHGTSDDDSALDRDLSWLRAKNIAAVLTLTEAPLPREALARHGIDSLHVPVSDMTAPLPVQFDEALGFVDCHTSQGHAVAIHCLMGQGRTGAILAAYRIRSGTTATEAIEEVRSLCPGAIQSDEQVRALRAFATRRDWML